MARTKIARTRFTPEEYAQLEQDAQDAGITPAEFLRTLYLERRRLPEQVESLDRRVRHLEEEVAGMWQRMGDRDEA